MKNIFFGSIIIIIVLGSMFAFTKSKQLNEGDGILFNQISLKEAEKIASKNNKLIFIYFHASWCGPCRQMKMETFSKKEVGDFYNKNFNNISFDVDKDEGRILSQKFQVTNIPYFLVLDKKNNAIVGKFYGYYSAEDFINIGKKILNNKSSQAKRKTK